MEIDWTDKLKQTVRHNFLEFKYFKHFQKSTKDINKQIKNPQTKYFCLYGVTVINTSCAGSYYNNESINE